MQILIIISIAICIFIPLYSNKIVGYFGEHWTKKQLKKLNNEYKTINDVMIRTKDGKTHQIDHIVVSKYGIFVIETKQYNGYLIGNDYGQKWKYISYGIKRNIDNPVHQNYGHQQSLKEVLNIEENKIIPLVCITSNIRMNVKSDKVVFENELVNKIKSFNIKIINNTDEIYNQINNLNILDKKERRNHIKNVKKIKKIKEIQSINKCPKCGGELVERNGIYGKFTGCSNYPRCKYTRK